MDGWDGVRERCTVVPSYCCGVVWCGVVPWTSRVGNVRLLPCYRLPGWVWVRHEATARACSLARGDVEGAARVWAALPCHAIDSTLRCSHRASPASWHSPESSLAILCVSPAVRHTPCSPIPHLELGRIHPPDLNPLYALPTHLLNLPHRPRPLRIQTIFLP